MWKNDRSLLHFANRLISSAQCSLSAIVCGLRRQLAPTRRPILNWYLLIPFATMRATSCCRQTTHLPVHTLAWWLHRWKPNDKDKPLLLMMENRRDYQILFYLFYFLRSFSFWCSFTAYACISVAFYRFSVSACYPRVYLVVQSISIYSYHSSHSSPPSGMCSVVVEYYIFDFEFRK